MLSHYAPQLAMALALTFGTAAAAQALPEGTFPTKPIRLLVGYAQGGSVDTIARTIAPALSRRLGQPVEVTNMAGASGSIAAVTAALAAPDGHTLLLGSPAEAGINHLLSRSSRFDPLRTLTPIGLVGSQPLVLVAGAGTSVRTIEDFLTYAWRKGGAARYGSSGHGTPLHLAGETVKHLADVQMEHVPYRGAGPMLPEVKRGATDFAVMVLSSALPHVRDGSLNAIGVTQARRTQAAPDIPALAEHPRLQDLDISVWFGLLGPARLPPQVTQRLKAELHAVLQDDALRERLASSGVTLMDGIDFGPFLKSELRKFSLALTRARLRH